MLLAKVDELGTPAWAFAFVFGLWLFWPLGLLVLAYLFCSGRLRAMDAASGRWAGRSWAGSVAPSGDPAFDHHRERTSQRLEEEQGEFRVYLERLRRTRDEAEFDRFMAERRRRSDTTPLVSPDRAHTEVSARLTPT